MATKSGKGKQRGHGEGALYYSRALGRWVGILDLGADPSGRRRRRKFTGDTRAAVQDKMRDARRELDEGKPLGKANDTVAALLRDFYDHGLPATTKSNNTRAGYAWAIEKHLTPTLGARKLRELSPDDVDKLLQGKAQSARDAKGRPKPGLSRASLAHIHQVLTRALRWGERRGRVSRNAAALVDTPDGARRPSKAFTVDEAKAFLEAARGERLEAAWMVMFMMGLRPGETFALSWEAIDLEAGVIEVRASLRRNQVDNTLSIVSTKTPRSRRRLDTPAAVLDALRKRKREQTEERLKAGERWGNENQLVFTSELGGPLDPSAVRRRFKKTARTAGLGDRHPHECRHSVASILSAQGVPLEQISDVLGHDGSRTTEQVYRHVITPSIASGKSVMESVLGSGANAN